MEGAGGWQGTMSAESKAYCQKHEEEAPVNVPGFILLSNLHFQTPKLHYTFLRGSDITSWKGKRISSLIFLRKGL